MLIKYYIISFIAFFIVYYPILCLMDKLMPINNKVKWKQNIWFSTFCSIICVISFKNAFIEHFNL